MIDQDAIRRTGNLAAVQGAFDGVSAADAERQLAHYTGDLVLELPFTEPPRRIEGRDQALPFLTKAFETYKIILTIDEVHEGLDPDLLVVEFSSDGYMATTGSTYANRYIAVMRFRNGKICFQREFFNPKISDRSLAGPEPLSPDIATRR